jgi:hypothetical protein
MICTISLICARLLFLKRLDDRENAAERQAKRKGTTYQPSVKKEMRGVLDADESQRGVESSEECRLPRVGRVG